jgi:hypothetical protein
VPYATKPLFVTFTAARRARKSVAVQLNESAHRPNGRGIETVPTLQNWISQSPANLDVVAPIKARVRDALHAVLRGKPPRQEAPSSRIMRKGVERC